MNYSGKGELATMRLAINYAGSIHQLLKSQAESCSASRVLDFGAGDGLYSQKIRAIVDEVDCIEVDPELSDGLRRMGFSVFSEVSQSSQAYDLVYSVNVLEHIENDGAVISSINTALSEGGVFVLYVPAFDLLFSEMDKMVGHKRRYLRSELSEKVRYHGFNIIESFYTDQIGFICTLILKLLGRSPMVNRNSVVFFDRWLFPLNKIIFRMSKNFFGKNLVIVAQKK